MEVSVIIRFTTPCLGNVRGSVGEMLRDAQGRVIFLQSWWRAGLGFAAQALCRYQKEVAEVQTDPVVEGTLSNYERYYAPDKSQTHEAFDAGTTLRVRFLLPRKMDAKGFRELLKLSGKYVGISPYGYRQDFGRFTVESVDVVRERPIKRERNRSVTRGEN